MQSGESLKAISESSYHRMLSREIFIHSAAYSSMLGAVVLAAFRTTCADLIQPFVSQEP